MADRENRAGLRCIPRWEDQGRLDRRSKQRGVVSGRLLGSVALSDPPPRAQQILRRLEGNESRKNQAGGPHSKVCLFRSRRIALKVDLAGSLAVSDLDDGSMQQCPPPCTARNRVSGIDLRFCALPVAAQQAG